MTPEERDLLFQLAAANIGNRSRRQGDGDGYASLPDSIETHSYVLFKSRQFNYNLPVAAALLPAAMAAPVRGQINLLNDMDFLWVSTSYFADVALAGQTDATAVVPLVMTQFWLNSEPFQDQAVPLPTIAHGPNRCPYKLPTPIWLPGGGTLNVDMQNVDAAQAYGLSITLHGVRYVKRDKG